MKNSDGFTYTYSAHEQEEIKRIRDKYIEKDKKPSTLERIKEIDKKVSDKATAVSIAAGVIGLLIMGTGMSFVMVWSSSLMVAGVVTGIIGIAVTAAAYPIYNITIKAERKKVAPEILRLTDELIEQ